MKKTNKKGFTIVELVIVIAVIAILAGVMIPTFSGIIKNANESKAKQEAKSAYTLTVSDDLKDGNSAGAVAYGNAVHVHHNGYCVSIDKNGAVTGAVETPETCSSAATALKINATSGMLELETPVQGGGSQ